MEIKLVCRGRDRAEQKIEVETVKEQRTSKTESGQLRRITVLLPGAPSGVLGDISLGYLFGGFVFAQWELDCF
ncbi:hypothetical protein AOXY_G3735 [Acipenser oxyrinchus oxyrinchus]|uniref:Uncharacterized protein n=1 Tax=Acipenser oxyrinchus oxyrinchus TaxID=40147 RepID=A0AAD8GG00_ACIOX|nr:hypothetical protein AOXY_G3735 [Acipenser oxyrinchus oxyrinchus]